METVNELRVCKRCLLKDRDQSKEKNIVYQYISELPSKDKASDELFNKRLDICRSCPCLIQATCQACGCFVEARAAVARQKCPYKKW